MGGNFIPVTLSIAAACALINLWLQVRVGRARQSEKVSIGDGGNELVIRRMRAHSNFVENAPFVLALLLALELAQGTRWWLWAVGGAFVLGRLAHPFGMDGVKYARSTGTALSMIVLAFLAIWAVVVVYQGRAPADADRIDAVPLQG